MKIYEMIKEKNEDNSINYSLKVFISGKKKNNKKKKGGISGKIKKKKNKKKEQFPKQLDHHYPE
jgi:hypothetical protein